ncbi:MAG: hypothetical protein JNK16_00555 [Phycisphaerales bacterium]|nr:hypothetical protein [Phycisphaerales bacterium]
MLSQFNITRASIVMVAAGLPSVAFAQVKDVAPYPAAFIASNADVHSGDTAAFYRVASADAGAIVIVDGESANWSRISYPAGSFAIVRAEDATYDANTKELKLAKPSKLFAGNKTSGFAGSWKALLLTPLPAGTTLKVLQVEDGGNGTGAVAYRVPVPADARAYTETKNLRKATPAEVSAFRSKGGVIAETATAVAPASASPSSTAPFAPPASTPAPATPSPQPAASSPVASAPAPTTPAVDNSLVAPVNTTGTGGTPAAPASTPTTSAPAATAPAPVTIDQSAGSTATTPASHAAGTTVPVASPAPAATAPVQAAPISANMRSAARIKELDQAFDRVNAQPLGEAEYETLISEYERTIQQLSGQLSPRQRAQLEQRLNILKFRKDLRQQQLALLNESGSAQAQNQQVLQGVAQVEATRVYSIVGQLQPSTVYNGQTLPLMFRIQSVGTSVPRTLGYIKPDPQFNLESKLGQIVGVIGEASMDKDLKLNVITPVRIDLLQGIPMQQTQQPPMQIPAAPSGQLPPVQMPDQGQQLPPRQIEVTK